MPDYLKRFQEDGFVVISDIAPAHLLDGVLQNTNSLQESITSRHFSEEKPWLSDAFHQHLIELRKTNPTTFARLYDSAQSSTALDQLVTSSGIINMVSILLEIEPSELSTSGHIQRIDVPDDIRNLYGWHQETPYYPQNKNGLNGLTVWMPLLDVSEEGGALHIAIGSHKEPTFQTTPIQESGLHSTQYTIPDEIIEKYEQVRAPLNRGSAVFFYNTFAHKSGENMSNRVRFAAIGRFHKATSPDFIPFRHKYILKQ